LKNEIKPSDTLKFIFIAMAAVCVIIFIAGLIFSKEPLHFTLGLIFGSVISVIRILMLAKSINISVDMEPSEAKVYMMGQYHLRMLMIVVAVVVGAMTKGVLGIFGIIAGLIAMQPSVYIANFMYEKLGGEKFESISAKKADRHS
jgi:hypothetical protein